MGKFKTPPDTGVAGKSKKSKKKASKDKLLKTGDSVAKDLDDMAAYDTATLDLSNATKSREALLQVIEMSKKQAQAMRAIMKENKELKAAGTRGDRGAGRAPKSLNNPTFPDSCKFDPEQTDLLTSMRSSPTLRYTPSWWTRRICCTRCGSACHGMCVS